MVMSNDLCLNMVVGSNPDTIKNSRMTERKKNKSRKTRHQKPTSTNYYNIKYNFPCKRISYYQRLQYLSLWSWVRAPGPFIKRQKISFLEVKNNLPDTLLSPLPRVMYYMNRPLQLLLVWKFFLHRNKFLKNSE